MFERLRAWRTGVAKELGMPPYVIFHDSTLRQIAAAPPSTLDGLAAVNGVGQTKLERYGQQILEILGDRRLSGKKRLLGRTETGVKPHGNHGCLRGNEPWSHSGTGTV